MKYILNIIIILLLTGCYGEIPINKLGYKNKYKCEDCEKIEINYSKCLKNENVSNISFISTGKKIYGNTSDIKIYADYKDSIKNNHRVEGVSDITSISLFSEEKNIQLTWPDKFVGKAMQEKNQVFIFLNKSIIHNNDYADFSKLLDSSISELCENIDIIESNIKDKNKDYSSTWPKNN